LNPFTNRLLKRWMDARANETIDVTSPDFKERMVQKALMAFGKKDPKVTNDLPPCPQRSCFANIW